MYKYFFILGRNRVLSVAEISSVFCKHRVFDFKPVFLEKEVFVVETLQKVDLKRINNDLGGVIKCGIIISEKEKGSELKKSLSELLKIETILEIIKKTDKKIMLGFSLYVQKQKIFGEVKNLLQGLFIDLKKEFKNKGITSRVVSSSGRTLSSVVVKKNKLITQGAELNFFIFGSKILVGRTECLQDFESFGFRDFSRPARDMEIGMMPPKLARIMINISGANKNDILLDPFCGCGTILQEALLLGLQKIVGSDVSSNAVNKTKINIKWLREKYRINDRKIRIFEMDILNISRELKENSVDVVVTEPYLGPALKKNISSKKIKKTTDELIHLYRIFFREIKKVLRKRGKIVIIWPVFKAQKGFINLPILDEVIKMGFSQERILPESLKNKSFSELTRRGSAIYSREDQNVLREIFIFSAKGGSASG